MITRREMLVLAPALVGTILAGQAVAQQQAKTATVTLTIEGMT